MFSRASVDDDARASIFDHEKRRVLRCFSVINQDKKIVHMNSASAFYDLSDCVCVREPQFSTNNPNQ